MDLFTTIATECVFLQVVSGDLVSDVPPGAVAAAHRRHDAVVTAMLCSVPVSGPSESGSSGPKDKTKKPGRYNIIGMDPTKQFLLYIATGSDFKNVFHIANYLNWSLCGIGDTFLQELKLRRTLEFRRAFFVQLAR